MVFGLDAPTTIGPDVLASRPPVLPPPPETPVRILAGPPLAFPAGRARGARSVRMRRGLGRQRHQRRQGERPHAPDPPAPRAPVAWSPRHCPPPLALDLRAHPLKGRANPPLSVKPLGFMERERDRFGVAKK